MFNNLFNFRNKGFFSPHYWDDVLEDLKDKATERRKKVFHVLAGPTLVKVKFEASKRDEFGKFASLECQVLEVDGVSVPKEMKDESTGYTEVASSFLGQENQIGLLCDTLNKLGIKGKQILVTDQYAQSHLRVIRLKQRLGKQKRR